MNPLVSCIVPAWNAERFIREAINTILRQTHRPLEVIVVDDGSTDGTAAAVDRIDPQVRCVRQQNTGPAAARNRGAADARGDFLAFLDADDLWPPSRLATQLVPLIDRPELDYTICRIQNVWLPGQEPAAAERDHPRNRPLPGYVAAGMVVRRAAFERVGPFDATLDHGDAADWFLRARALGLGELLLDDVLVHRRLHGANRSQVMAAESRDEFLHIIKKSLDSRRTRPPGDAP